MHLAVAPASLSDSRQHFRPPTVNPRARPAHANLNDSIQKTLRVLESSGNEAANDVLLAALDSPNASIRNAALAALLHRHCLAGQRAALTRFFDSDDGWRQAICAHKGALLQVLKNALVASSTPEKAHACRVARAVQEYDVVPTLVQIVEVEGHPVATLAAETIVELADALLDELADTADGRRGRDLEFVRHRLTGVLEESVRRFSQHQSDAIVEAFLILVARENATLQHILFDPHDAAYLATVRLLRTSQRPGVIRLLLSCLDAPHAATAALGAIGHRGDPHFVELLLKKVGRDPTLLVRHNLARIERYSWLPETPRTLSPLDEVSQEAAAHLIAASGFNLAKKIAWLGFVLRQGPTLARTAAASALGQFSGPMADSLVVEALDSGHPEVQAVLLSQIRPRGIKAGLGLLVDYLDSPHECVRQAASAELTEFSIERYLATFDVSDDDARRSAGTLVRKVDPHAIAVLESEFDSPSSRRRIRALGAAAAMNLVDHLEPKIVKLLADEDPILRVEAARILAAGESEAALRELDNARTDANALVRDTALRSLAAASHRRAMAETLPFVPRSKS